MAAFIRIVYIMFVLHFYVLFCMKLAFALMNVSKISKIMVIVPRFVIIMETHFGA